MANDKRNKLLLLGALVAIILLLLFFKPSMLPWNPSGNGTCWDGNCTPAIVDQCCPDCINVRLCSDQLVDDPTQCLDKYCTASGQFCQPIYQENVATTGKWACSCKSVSSPFPN